MQHQNLFVFDIETMPDTDAVPSLTGFDDPDVDEGRIEDVRHYCETDVLTIYLAYLRLMVHRGTIGIDGYNAAISDIVALIEQEAGERPYLNDFMEAWS